ncbi:TPA: site-specific DNA-methyltransferase [Citrobacter farmeri]|nr:site-specific DNA-methyltransferase [Citrobacter farmeri]
MQNLFQELIDLLSIDDRLVSEGKLMKNKVVELALNLDPVLISHLLKNQSLRKHFFVEVEGITVFDKIKFQKFVSNKKFLPDSFTAFKNKIGFTVNDELLSESNEVVLAWPYKDCILEGGQDKDDSKRKEVFWNETLAPDQIDRLLSPKVFVNLKKISKDGESYPEELSVNNNFLIKGNNLLALHSLKPFRGKVKLICIDPPYNKGGDDFNYNDSFNHSTWLTFMKNRLEVAKTLLHRNGTIFIFCDDDEHAYLKVLCDEVMGRESFIATVVWKHSDNSNNDAKKFSADHNYILVYSNNEKWESIKLERGEENASHFSNPDEDPRGPWFDGNPVNSPNPRPNLMYDIPTPNGNIIKHPPNGWRWDKETLAEKMATGEIFFNEKQTGIKRITYLWEQKALPPSTLWSIEEENAWFDLDETGHTRQAKNEQKKIFKGLPTSDLFKTPKPERVIKKIVDISTHEGDLVMDFFSGSGTTAAVAMKMKRQFIAIEQMDYIQTFTLPRLVEVVNGEKGGISKDVGWTGGSEFIYCELAQANQEFIEAIQSAKSSDELLTIWSTMQDKAFLSYRVNPKAFDESKTEFTELSIEDQRKFLIETLDKNMLYVPLSEIDDETYSISDADKALNKKFFG